jgi:hypothetical protein
LDLCSELVSKQFEVERIWLTDELVLQVGGTVGYFEYFDAKMVRLEYLFTESSAEF